MSFKVMPPFSWMQTKTRFNRPYNRYPDPLQWELKKKIAEIKGVKRESIFLGNGSDEPIDLIIRAFLRTVYRQHRKHRAFLRHV